MSVKAYNDACLRAELFGQPKPDREEFLEKNKHLDVVELQEADIKTAETTAILNDNFATTSGGFNELNSILGSTQSKLNRLKGVCGSLTNLLRFKLTAKDNLSYSSEPSYVGQANYDSDYRPPNNPDLNLGPINSGLGPEDNATSSIPTISVHKFTKTEPGDINSAIGDLKTMQQVEKTSLVSKATAKDMKQQVSSQVDKLDALLSKADHASSSMQHQNKQMRSFLR